MQAPTSLPISMVLSTEPLHVLIKDLPGTAVRIPSSYTPVDIIILNTDSVGSRTTRSRRRYTAVTYDIEQRRR